MAVYTDVSFEDLERFLRAYDVGAPLSFKGIAEGVENSNFFLRTDRGAFILTLYEKRVRAEDLPFFLGLMEHLSSRGIACPLPVRRGDGALFGTLNGRPAALLTFLDGVSLRLTDGVTGLLGPNGAGKTTLLKVLATAVQPDSGGFTVRGEDPSTPAGRLAVRSTLGYLPQTPGFHPDFTAFEFVDYVAILKELGVDREAEGY